MPAGEWFKEWFSSPYYDLLYYKRNEEEAKKFVLCLVNYLQPKTRSSMLDVGCGKGRHSRALADAGFDVTGIDLSAPFIAEAKKYERDNLHFFQHDIRLPCWINYFDYAFNFFTSFGYFRTRREHDDAMRTIVQSLHENGTLVIDYLNVHYAEDNMKKSEDLQLDDIHFHITRRYDEEHFFKQIQIEDENHPVKHFFTEKVMKFSLGDFTEMLAYQGMQVKEVFGDYGLGHYDVRKSPRMIIIAGRRPR